MLKKKNEQIVIVVTSPERNTIEDSAELAHTNDALRVRVVVHVHDGVIEKVIYVGK